MSTVVIVGGGASVKEGISNGLWKKIKHLDIITCNNAICHIPYPPKYACWIDSTKRDPTVTKKILETDCIRVTCQLHDTRDDDKVVRFPMVKDLNGDESKLTRGLERGVLYIGKRKFTGIFAISLALYAGYNKIYLLGFDWNVDKKGNAEWYKRPSGYDAEPAPAIFLRKGKVRDDVAEHHDYFKGKADIINVSVKSNIPSFPKISYSEFFKQIGGAK